MKSKHESFFHSCWLSKGKKSPKPNNQKKIYLLCPILVPAIRPLAPLLSSYQSPWFYVFLRQRKLIKITIIKYFLLSKTTSNYVEAWIVLVAEGLHTFYIEKKFQLPAPRKLLRKMALLKVSNLKILLFDGLTFCFVKPYIHAWCL